GGSLDFGRAAAPAPAAVSQVRRSGSESAKSTPESQSDPGPWPERAAYTLAAEVGQALDALADPSRMVVVLRDVHGLALTEIAELMGCRLATVKAHLRRGRFELRQRLAQFVDEA